MAINRWWTADHSPTVSLPPSIAVNCSQVHSLGREASKVTPLLPSHESPIVIKRWWTGCHSAKVLGSVGVEVGDEGCAGDETGGGEGFGSDGGDGDGDAGGGGGGDVGDVGGSGGGGAGAPYPSTASSSIASVRDTPGSRSVTNRPTTPQLAVNGPTVAAASPLSHSAAPLLIGSPATSPTHTLYRPSRSWQQSERP